MAIKISSATNTGMIRKQNEDEIIELIPDINDTVLAGVIDGVGGYAGGMEAAQIAKSSIERVVMNYTKETDPSLLLRVAFIEANNRIFEERAVNPVYHKMSCVLTCALLSTETQAMHYVHCGDSRAYVYRNGELLKITKDHSLVGSLEDNGNLLEEDALNHPRRNEIFKMLGEKRLESTSEYFDSGEYSFYPGDTVLFCTDGLTDLVNKAGIKHILLENISLTEKCEQLIGAANSLGGKDNITVSLVHYEKMDEVVTPTIQQKETVVQTSLPKTRKKRSGLAILFFLAILGIGAYFLGNWYYRYDDVDPHYNGRALVKKNGKYGFIDKKGNLIIPMIYDSAYRFSDGLAAVKFGDMWGFVDTLGKMVIPATFDHAMPFTENLAAVESEGKWGFINRKGEIVVPPSFQQVESFYEDLAAFKVENKWGFIDTSGVPAIPAVYDRVSGFQNGVSEVIIDNDICYIDKEGVFTSESVVFEKENFKLIKTIRENKWGYIDKEGKTVIPFVFDEVKVFSEGLLPVKRFGRWFFIDEKGNYIIYK